MPIVADEHCARCGIEDPDLRTLRMACLYQMDELSIPLKKDGGYYTLKVCKPCRADWLYAIEAWYKTPIKSRETGTGVYVRYLGSNRELTREEVLLPHGDLDDEVV